MPRSDALAANSETPLDAVRTAVKEFLATAGQRLTAVACQPRWTMPHDHPDLAHSER